MAYHPKIVKPVTIKGNRTKKTMIPKTKSSCLPDVNLYPKIPIERYATRIANAIQTIPKYFFIAFIVFYFSREVY